VGPLGPISRSQTAKLKKPKKQELAKEIEDKRAYFERIHISNDFFLPIQ
jgi:hypothetical protein